jgi:hypothetical protein
VSAALFMNELSNFIQLAAAVILILKRLRPSSKSVLGVRRRDRATGRENFTQQRKRDSITQANRRAAEGVNKKQGSVSCSHSFIAYGLWQAYLLR